MAREADNTNGIRRVKRSEIKESNPPHTTTAYIPLYTPPDVRLGLALLPARYVLRGGLKSLTNAITPNEVRQPFYDSIGRFFGFNKDAGQTKNQVNKLIDAHPEFKEELEKIVSEDGRTMAQVSQNDMGRALKYTPSGQKLNAAVKECLSEWGLSGRAENMLQYAFIEGNEGRVGRITDRSIKDIHHAIQSNLFNFSYDTALGVGSVGMDSALTNRAINDMKSVYSEAIAYENGKKPKDVTLGDIFKSENKIIRSTKRNFIRKSFERFGTDTLFFLRHLRVPVKFAWVEAGELAIGAKGLLWANDVWGREPTMLESFTYFINDKLNPKFGIGDPISSGDIINFYQQYCSIYHPEQMFKSIEGPNITEGRTWARGEVIFDRVAYLMNHTYNYKHTTEIDPETNLPVPSAHFDLPKFIYLLGHDLINPLQPEMTMAFVEVANSYGMDAVKDMEAQMHDKVPLRDMLAQYPVDIQRVMETPSQAGVSSFIGSPQGSSQPAPRPRSPEEERYENQRANNQKNASHTKAPKAVIEVRDAQLQERLQQAEQQNLTRH